MADDHFKESDKCRVPQERGGLESIKAQSRKAKPSQAKPIRMYDMDEPKLPLRLAPQVQRILSYSGPAVLTAILAPIVFLPEGDLWLAPTNPYLLCAVLAAILIYKTANVLMTTVVSMVVFLLLNNLIF